MHPKLSGIMDPPSNFKVPETRGISNDVRNLEHCVDQVSSQVNLLERRVQEVEHFFSNHNKKLHMNSKSKDKGRHSSSIKKQQDHISPSQVMKELMHQFGVIMDQIILGKGARDSVDAKDLGLHNVNPLEVNGKPRDFTEIKKKMETKDGTGYNHVREIYADVRSVLKNAMKYNDERSDAHVTAKSVLARFEEKWLLLLPKVMQEEERMEEDQFLELPDLAQMAKDLSSELYQAEKYLNELKEVAVRKCRRMSTLEKRELGNALTQLSADELRQALEIVAEDNPAFQASAEEVDLDIDAQSESTLRRLKHFIKEVWKARVNLSLGGENNDSYNNTNADTNPKRKRDVLDAVGNNPKKKTKKHG